MSKQIAQFKQFDEKTLLSEIAKRKQQLVEERAKLANQGRKNSNQTAKVKKEVARLETILNEKIIASFKEQNG